MCSAAWYSVFFFFKQKTAYEMRISDWSSDVCSSDLHVDGEIDVDGVADASTARGIGEIPGGLGDQGISVVVEPVDQRADRGVLLILEIGRASCRERVCQYV